MSRNIPKQLLQGCVLWLDSNGKDLSGNQNNGTLVNSPTKVRVLQNDGLSYGGTNYIKADTGTVNQIFTTNEYINITSNLTNERFTFSYGGDATGEYLLDVGIWQSYGYRFVVRIAQQNTSNLTIFDTGFTPVVGKFYQISVVRNGTNIQFYINGLLFSSTNSASTQNLSNGKVSIAVDGGYTINGFNGKIVNPMLWNRALSAKEIEMLYYSTFIK